MDNHFSVMFFTNFWKENTGIKKPSTVDLPLNERIEAIKELVTHFDKVSWMYNIAMQSLIAVNLSDSGA